MSGKTASPTNNPFIIITGSPGSGKTTLLDAIAARGFSVTPEAGRGIIRAQDSIDGPALPWKDKNLFAETMLVWEMRNYDEAAHNPAPVFFDRGIPDIAGYLTLHGLMLPCHLLKAMAERRYHPQVFIAPPWADIFEKDPERRQDWDEAVRTYHAMRAIYTAQNYRLIELPLDTVEARADFILANVLHDRPYAFSSSSH